MPTQIQILDFLRAVKEVAGVAVDVVSSLVVSVAGLIHIYRKMFPHEHQK